MRNLLTKLDLSSNRSKEVVIQEITKTLASSGYRSSMEVNQSKPWGGYILFDQRDTKRFLRDFFDNKYQFEPGQDISIKLLIAEPKARLSWQYHDRRSEIWRFLNKGLVVTSETDFQAEPISKDTDEIIEIAAAERHRLIGDDRQYTLVAEIWQHTNPHNLSSEDDIVRLDDDYNRRRNIVVILASGNGTRLWPLSTKKKPKQFVNVADLDNSMIRLTYERVDNGLNEIFVSTREEYLEFVREQIPELDDDHIIIEPMRRGTSSIIALCLDYLKKLKYDENDAVVFIPSDHQIRNKDGFLKSIEYAGQVTEQDKRITLVGVEPSSPSEQYGYIEKDHLKLSAGQDVLKNNYNLAKREYYTVKSFKEKPNYQTAVKYLQTGRYYWNCGIFAATRRVFENSMWRFAPEFYQNYCKLNDIDGFGSEEYAQQYQAFADEAIDRVLIEKVTDLAVVEASFDWADVGSFEQLCNNVNKDETGNFVSGDNNYVIDSRRVYVRNENPDLPVAVIGVSDLVIVNTKEGILITNKSESTRVGEIAKKVDL